jgi:hypothetical protein
MYNGSITANAVTPSVNMKSRIINGAMVIDQRNAGASVTNVGSASTYTLDRWFYFASQASKFTVQQDAGAVTPPVGFNDYLGITSSSAYTVGSSEIFLLSQHIEGFNVADLNWGTANAKTVTLSFWVRSSLTGTFGGSLRNNASDRSYPFTYTINSANTWEYETITIAGDTSGTWLTTNGTGIRLAFGLGMGSSFSGTTGAWAAGNFISATGATSVVGTNGATFYITGVQLEVGSTATSFDYRPYGTELALAQRYYFKNAPTGLFSQLGVFGTAGSTTAVVGPATFPVVMRTTPTVTTSNARLADGNAGLSFSAITISWAGSWATELNFTVTGATQYRPYYLQNNNSAAGYIDFSAEL